MPGDKALFAPAPLRAMAADLSGLQLRTLMCVAAHDRLSLITGKGQGCRASNERMSQLLGCSYAGLCKTLSELVDVGYLQREKLGRHTVYRVIYDERDRLLFSNVIGAAKGSLSARRGGTTHCQASLKSAGKPPETAPQYIPLNGERYSVETGENNSSEEARFAARGSSGKKSSAENVGAQLATIERDLKVGNPLNRLELVEWIGGGLLAHDYGETIRNWAVRIADALIETMTEEEHAQWRASHGWLDEVQAA